MATLLFTAIGTLIGGPLGGAIGALAGRQVDQAIIGGRSREGPRLKELALTTSSYGSPMPRHYGRMRAPGTIIWATDLVEHKTKSGNGKGRPSTTTYSYTASFAVALSSRPVTAVGRIWADGNLLRGEAGDLKSSGTFRLHPGHGDQPVDPLIAAAEGANQCPAFRGLAYAVFEDLDLSDFGNRIPALTFEILADDGALSVADLVGDVLPECDARAELPGMQGLSVEGPAGEVLALLDPVWPMDCDAGASLTIARERLQSSAIALGEAAVGFGEARFGSQTGFSRRRSPESSAPIAALRYYDIARDFQPGVQRAPGRAAPGQPRSIELPAALEATTARNLISAAAGRAHWARQTLAWRIGELDPAVAPGAVVSVPGEAGLWRVRQWEWREDGIELALLRLPPAIDAAAAATDPGRSNPPADQFVPPTSIAAFELPWDGSGGGGSPALFAAVSSSGPGWTGAALFAQYRDSSLEPLGPSGRTRSTIGTALSPLEPANPLLFDRHNTLEIELVDPAMSLDPATPTQLANGANRALVGREIVQFTEATPLGAGRWRLGGLLRGRGGTEAGIAGHLAGERFVLLDASLIALDQALVGVDPETRIAALGRGDGDYVSSPIALYGATLAPLSPVHGHGRLLEDGALALSWTRRARGAWLWRDYVDAPLSESLERYEVSFGATEAVLARWELAAAGLEIAAAQLNALQTQMPGGAFRVRQIGDHAVSLPLVIPIP